jgi:ABC-type ATPase involved in cell division
VKKICTVFVLRSQNYEFVFNRILGQSSGGKALLYHVIEVKTEVKCGKVYLIHHDTEAAVHNDDIKVHIVR